jgi:hypothetical protein
MSLASRPGFDSGRGCMAKLLGKVISDDEAEDYGVLAPTFTDQPVVSGQGSNDWHCGNCDHLLASKMGAGQMQRVGVKCPDCGRVNVLTG